MGELAGSFAAARMTGKLTNESGGMVAIEDAQSRIGVRRSYSVTKALGLLERR